MAKEEVKKINKDKALKVINPKLLLIYLTAALEMGLMLGCAPAKADEIVEDEKPTIEQVTPEPISTATVSPTPTVKPTPKPTAMPFITPTPSPTATPIPTPTLTREQIIQRLGIDFKEDDYKATQIFVIHFVQNEQDKFIFVGYKGINSYEVEFVSIFNYKFLFRVKNNYESKPFAFYKVPNYELVDLNPLLEKIEIKHCFNLNELPRVLEELGMEYVEDSFIEKIKNLEADEFNDRNYSITTTYILDLYLKEFKPENMLFAYDYDSSYSGPTPTVSPTATISPTGYKEKTDPNVAKGYNTINYWNNRPKTMTVNSINKGGYSSYKGRSIA